MCMRFPASKINELKIGYTRYQVDARPFFAGQALATQLGIPGINDPNNPVTGGLPNIQISGLNSLGNGDWFPEVLHENNYQLLDSFTYIHGRHSFKVGGDLRRRQHGFFQVQNARGDFSTPDNSPVPIQTLIPSPWPTFSSVTPRVFSATRKPEPMACAGGSSAPI